MNPLAEAIAWHQLGYTPVPVATDGTKRPAVTWQHLQHHQPDATTIIDLFTIDTDGIGLICGESSGNLEMLELEARAVTTGLLNQLEQAFTDHGLDKLWHRIDQGYSETSPSGGIHWYYRVTGCPVAGNTRLARTPDKHVLIETRGQGGYTVIAPSTGRTHPDGDYRIRTGDRTTVPTITADEYAALHAICTTLDQAPTLEATPTTGRTRQPCDPLRPGDDFNERATWDEILTPHGWTKQAQYGRSTTWRKPGKRRPGISATTGRAADADRLFVFSTSTDFEPEKPYSKFAAYALLEHNGDHTKAAKALREQGYGDQTEIAPSDPLAGLLAPQPAPATMSTPATPTADGNLAVAPTETPRLVDTSRAAQAFGPTEDGTARALAHLHQHQLRYCAQRGSWLYWDHSRWVWDSGDHHRQYIKELARTLPEDDGWKSYKKRALSAAGTTGIARQAESEPDFAVHIDQLDANPYELNTPAGVVNLRTGEIRPPDPAALHTRTTAVAPDFDRPGELFDRFLATTFNNDQALIGYVQRLLGLSMIGTVLEQLLPFAHGSGANGKSTLIEAAMDTLGRGETGYAIAAPVEMLMIRRHSEHPAELAQLAGARLVVCSELEDGARFAEARIKQLTGRDSVNARFMRGNPFTFTPTHTIWLIGNHKPAATTGGPAFWRRLSLIPFEHVVPDGQRDKRLPEKLQAESPAILAWMIRGAADYMASGLQAPQAVTTATGEYARDQDTIGRFVDEQCHLAPGQPMVQVAVARLRDAYEQFCREMGDEPASAKRFGTELRDRFGIESVKGAKGRRSYHGISLATDEAEQGWIE